MTCNWIAAPSGSSQACATGIGFWVSGHFVRADSDGEEIPLDPTGRGHEQFRIHPHDDVRLYFDRAMPPEPDMRSLRPDRALRQGALVRNTVRVDELVIECAGCRGSDVDVVRVDESHSERGYLHLDWGRVPFPT